MRFFREKGKSAWELKSKSAKLKTEKAKTRGVFR